MDVHYALGYRFDLAVLLLHETPLHLELDLQILLLVKRILMGLVATAMSKFIPCTACILFFLLILAALSCWKFLFLSFYLSGCEGFVIIGRIQKLLSSISLNPKLLLGCSNLPCRIRIEVRLLELYEGIFYLFDTAVDH